MLSRAFIIVIVCSIGIICCYGVYLFNKKTGGLENESTDYTISAKQLFEVFNADESSSNKRYLNKIIKVSGQIIKVEGNPVQRIITLGNINQSGGVSCLFRYPVRSSDSLFVGRAVTIKGKCTGFLMDVDLVDCLIDK